MERKAVVELVVDQLRKVADRDGRVVGVQLDLDGAKVLDLYGRVMDARVMVPVSVAAEVLDESAEESLDESLDVLWSCGMVLDPPQPYSASDARIPIEVPKKVRRVIGDGMVTPLLHLYFLYKRIPTRLFGFVMDRTS